MTSSKSSTWSKARTCNPRGNLNWKVWQARINLNLWLRRCRLLKWTSRGNLWARSMKTSTACIKRQIAPLVTLPNNRYLWLPQAALTPSLLQWVWIRFGQTIESPTCQTLKVVTIYVVKRSKRRDWPCPKSRRHPISASPQNTANRMPQSFPAQSKSNFSKLHKLLS